VCQWPSLVEGYKVWLSAMAPCPPSLADSPLIVCVCVRDHDLDRQEVVLTPNFPEYQRLCKAAGCKEDTPVMDLAKKYDISNARFVRA
jgi:hypothetical protein